MGQEEKYIEVTLNHVCLNSLSLSLCAILPLPSQLNPLGRGVEPILAPTPHP